MAFSTNCIWILLSVDDIRPGSANAIQFAKILLLLR